MGKKDHKKKKSSGAGKQVKNRIIGIGLVALAIFGMMAYLGYLPGATPSDRHVVGGETQPVLSSTQFPPKASVAYALAAKYRETFDQVFCYCGCERWPTRHKSLLSCFTDTHGAT